MKINARATFKYSQNLKETGVKSDLEVAHKT